MWRGAFGQRQLRYSLRALQRFFPEHGHVYIVTDAQAPTWLRRSKRITVIDHRDLIPAAALPTFDWADRVYIHRIPNLSERYFYFNDDVFFGAPVKVSDRFGRRCAVCCGATQQRRRVCGLVG
ncbi:hypothetical protein ACVBEH_03225 [Roseateles sp. GG27B]